MDHFMPLHGLYLRRVSEEGSKRVMTYDTAYPNERRIFRPHHSALPLWHRLVNSASEVTGQEAQTLLRVFGVHFIERSA